MPDIPRSPSIGSVPNYRGGHEEIVNATETLTTGAPMCLLGVNDNRELVVMMRLGEGRIALAATAMKQLVYATAHLIHQSPDLRQLFETELARHDDAAASEKDATE